MNQRPRTRKKSSKPVEVRVSFTAEQHAWAKEQAQEQRCTIQEVARQAMQRLMDAPPQTLLPANATVADKKQAILAGIEKSMNGARAARDAGLTRAEYYGWLHEDPKFCAEVEMAQEACVADAEGALLAIGRGDRGTKSNSQTLALLAFLNAHNPSYGRIRSEVVARVMGPMIDGLLEVVTKYLDPDQLKEFQAELGRVIQFESLKRGFDESAKGRGYLVE